MKLVFRRGLIKAFILIAILVASMAAISANAQYYIRKKPSDNSNTTKPWVPQVYQPSQPPVPLETSPQEPPPKIAPDPVMAPEPEAVLPDLPVAPAEDDEDLFEVRYCPEDEMKMTKEYFDIIEKYANGYGDDDQYLGDQRIKKRYEYYMDLSSNPETEDVFFDMVNACLYQETKEKRSLQQGN